MIGPEDADDDERQGIGAEKRQSSFKRPETFPAGYRQFEHHDGENNRNHRIGKRDHAVSFHAPRSGVWRGKLQHGSAKAPKADRGS